MELLLFLIFFLLSAVILSLISYYYRLLYFSGKDSFYREEITDILSFLPSEFLFFIESEGDTAMGGMAFGFGIVFSYLWSLLAALFGASTYSNEFTTFFFLSCFIPLVFFYGAPLVEDYFAGNVGSSHPGTKLAGQTTAFVAGSTLTLMGLNLSLYGTYHEMSFFFVLFNFLSIGFVYIYRRREKMLDAMNESPGDDFSDEELPPADEEELET